MQHRNLKGNLIILVATIVWGMALVAQTAAARHLPAFSINALRCLVGALALLPAILIFSKVNGHRFFVQDPVYRKRLWAGGAQSGLMLCIAVNLQQFGIRFYPPDAAISGRAGFITTLYVILVPLFSIVLGRRVRFFLWCGIGLATVGTALLCFSSGIDHLYLGDLLIFACAVAFALQIMCLEHFVQTIDALRLSAVQFLICGALSAVLALVFDAPIGAAAWTAGVKEALLPLLNLGVVSCGVGYTCQTIGQQYADAPMASMTMSLESLFSALFGALLLGERMTFLQALGGILMFFALIVANLPQILPSFSRNDPNERTNEQKKEGSSDDDPQP